MKRSMKKIKSRTGIKKMVRPKKLASSLKSRGRTQTRALPTAFAYSRSVPFVRPLKLSHTEYLTTYTASQAVGTGTVLLDLPIGSKRASGVDETVTMPWFNQLSTLYKEFVVDNLTVRLTFQNGTSMSGAICIWYEPDVMFNTTGLTANAILQRANTTPGALVTSVFGSKAWKVTNVLPGRRYVTASGVGGDSDRLETAGRILIAAASNLPVGCTFSIDIDWAAKFYEPTIGQSSGGNPDEKVASRVFVTPTATPVPVSSVGAIFNHLTRAAQNVVPGFTRMAEQELARGARDTITDVLGASFARPGLNNEFNTKIYLPKGNWIFDATLKFVRSSVGSEPRVFATDENTSYNVESYDKQPYIDFQNGTGIVTLGTNTYEGILPAFDNWDSVAFSRYFCFGNDSAPTSIAAYKARSTIQVHSDGGPSAWIDPGLYTVDEAARDSVLAALSGDTAAGSAIKDMAIDLTVRETMMQSAASGTEVLFDERSCVLAPANSVFPALTANEEKSYVCVDQLSPSVRKMSIKPSEKVVNTGVRSSSQPPSVRVKNS